MNPLAAYLEDMEVLETREIKDAFARVDRRDFVREEDRGRAYEDSPLPIGFSQTISQPYTVAFMLELLQPKKGEAVLDVGSGSGWTAVLLASIVGETGMVYGTEMVPELLEFGIKNMAKYAFPQAKLLQAKKGETGLAAKAPFDRILVSAAAKEEIPRKLVEQLKEGGVMVLPVGDSVFTVRKTKTGEPDIKRFEGFAFVPLV
ncbi:MAG: protein-L-isoaspartate O-methyltransferase [bacterium]|nr:protein-L-isoaspartate O-methyltransferase [bacterium]